MGRGSEGFSSSEARNVRVCSTMKDSNNMDRIFYFSSDHPQPLRLMDAHVFAQKLVYGCNEIPIKNRNKQFLMLGDIIRWHIEDCEHKAAYMLLGPQC